MFFKNLKISNFSKLIYIYICFGSLFFLFLFLALLLLLLPSPLLPRKRKKRKHIFLRTRNGKRKDEKKNEKEKKKQKRNEKKKKREKNSCLILRGISAREPKRTKAPHTRTHATRHAPRATHTYTKTIPMRSDTPENNFRMKMAFAGQVGQKCA